MVVKKILLLGDVGTNAAQLGNPQLAQQLNNKQIMFLLSTEYDKVHSL
jgi:hypothetical protein